MKRWLGGVIILVFLGVGYWMLGPKQMVVRVIDGDTIELKDGRRVRYLGIDTPEEGECYRDEANKLNELLVMGKKVKLEFDEDTMDDYGRVLAYVYVDGEMVNKQLLSAGTGRYFYDEQTVKHEEQLMAAAEKSRQDRRGLWTACGGEAGCVIKGNIDKDNQRWFHLPNYRHYEQTEVNLDQGDRWFCTPEEAEKAGFERARE